MGRNGPKVMVGARDMEGRSHYDGEAAAAGKRGKAKDPVENPTDGIVSLFPPPLWAQ